MFTDRLIPRLYRIVLYLKQKTYQNPNDNGYYHIPYLYEFHQTKTTHGSNIGHKIVQTVHKSHKNNTRTKL